MIIDFHANPAHAVLYDVLDSTTYQTIDLPVWYADDSIGLIRVYEIEGRDENGWPIFRVNEAGDGVAWREIRRPIRIVRNGHEPAAPDDENPKQGPTMTSDPTSDRKGFTLPPAKSPCPDCAAPVGSLHKPGCDVERCPSCGHQAISCGCEDDELTDDDGTPLARLPWTGEWPGDSDAAVLGWYCLWVDGKGFVPCEADTPGATTDLNRLALAGVWDRKLARFVAPDDGNPAT